MATEKTLALIKPDAVRAGNTGHILSMMNKHGFQILALKMIKLTTEKAREFYSVHQDKEFFSPLVEFMTSGPIVAAVLAKENAIADYRKLMGSTDSTKAEPGTIRFFYGTNQRQNAVHGSDSLESARKEIRVMFQEQEIYA